MLTCVGISSISVGTMAKSKEGPQPPRADMGAKVNYTPGELDEIRAAVARAGEFKVATWLRKISLQVARGELMERKGGRR